VPLCEPRTRPAASRCVNCVRADITTTMRKTILVGLAGLLLLLVGASAASAKLDRDQLKSWLVKELQGRGLAVDKVGYCKPNAAHDVYSCVWHAEGEWPGEVPYECHGHARYEVKSRDWWVSACHNRIPTEIPLLPNPGPPPLVGFNQGWTEQPSLLGDAARAGSEVVRQNLSWDGVERNQGSYDWNTYDAFYRNALANGQLPLLLFVNAPCWAQAHPSDCLHGDDRMHPSPAHYDDAANFALAAARRYPLAIGLEVWNEPNWKYFWGSSPDPRAWGRLVKAVADRLHSAGVQMPVVSGGLIPLNQNHDTDSAMPQRKFLLRAYKTGGPQAADAIGTHPYPYRPWNDDYVGSVRAKLAEIDDVMGHHGDADKPIWVTETGVSTDNGFTLAQQGQALAAIYRTLLRVDHPIPVVIFHRLADTPYMNGSTDHYGLIDHAGHRKPAYCDVAAVLDHPC
jgi:hypothetical protein